MKTFAVTYAQNVREYTTYHIEAETAADAERVVLQADWKDDEDMPVAVDYEPCDDADPAVIDVQELE